MGGGSSGNTISFTIDGVAYQADNGMTWTQWVNSAYNTGGYTQNMNKILINPFTVVNDSNGYSVIPSSTINNNGVYSLGDYTTPIPE